MRQGDPEGVVRLCRQPLQDLETLESQHEAALAMSRHLVESVARAALQTSELDLAKDALARDLVVLQLAGLPLCVGLDRSAQRLHRRGLNILLDELPPIPLDVFTTAS
ncbi:MAG: hypothetical protein GY884_08505 [Proteobacteria bacterium]|nr:hypothetical protein [Pseudomonadota bacterium]